MKDWLLKLGVGGLLIGLTYFLGYQIERSNFVQLIALYGTFFLTYLSIYQFAASKKTIHFFVGLSIFLRFLLVFSIPNFSDDLYRFIWDGRLIAQGINPFNQLPSYYIENNVAISGLTAELFQQLNSPNYFTIYPPVNQIIFAIAATLFPNSIWGSSLVMKSALFAFEVGSILLIINLLRHFKLPAKNVLLYALNPLIILEITGNIHFEGAMIFFLLLAIWLIVVKKRWLFSAVVFALSVASKLLPLMFLPLLVRRIGDISPSSIKNRISIKAWLDLDWIKIIGYFVTIGITLMVLFFPLLNGVFLANFGDSLNLYFQKFEFNGSLYYFFRWIGFQIKGYNIIGTLGPTLAISAFLGIVLITLLEHSPIWPTLFQSMLFVICCYLFSSATVHPWYVSLPITFCVFTRFRFPILWSGLIFLTYINYSYHEYFENLWVVGIEYILVFGYLIYELVFSKTLEDEQIYSTLGANK